MGYNSEFTGKQVDNLLKNIYGKTIEITGAMLDVLLSNTNVADAAANNKIAGIFGSVGNYTNVVNDIVSNHTRYFFHVGSNINCIELGAVTVWKDSSNIYDLSFIITYYKENVPIAKHVTLRYHSYGSSMAVITDILTSDNITVISRKTPDEYSSITKDNKTMYIVTDN